MLLARLAVDLQAQGAGIGAALLKDAITRTVRAADIGGLRAFIAHAKHEKARNIYKNFALYPLTFRSVSFIRIDKRLKKTHIRLIIALNSPFFTRTLPLIRGLSVPRFFIRKNGEYFMSSGKFVKTLALTAAFAAVASGAQAESAPKEKCYGVAKAGQNDCAAGSCAGTAKVDNQGNAFLVMPKGLCEKLAGGSLKEIKE